VRFQSAQTPCGICASSKPVKAIAPGARCQPAEITGFPPDFNRAGSIRNSFTARPKTLFRVGSLENPAQAEAEDDSKIKDRLEALLFAETLQGTLSPNANPGKGSVGGLLNLMPRATAGIQRKAQRHWFTCPRLDLLYQTVRHCASGESKKLPALQSEGFCVGGWPTSPAGAQLQFLLNSEQEHNWGCATFRI